MLTTPYSDAELLASAAQYATKGHWLRGDRTKSNHAYHRGKEFYARCTAHMVSGHKHKLTKFTESVIIDSAAKCTHKAAWSRADHEKYLLAKKDKALWDKCTAHMRDPRRRSYADEELLASAKQFKTKSAWGVAEPSKSTHAYCRSKEFYAKCTAHMAPTVNAYNLPWHVYSFEFLDGHAYVGYTHQWQVRKRTHLRQGRVHQHLKICPKYQFRLLATELLSQADAGSLELSWSLEYKKLGWKLLNMQKCGLLVGAPAKKWSKEQCLTIAAKYATPQEWYHACRGSGTAAKAFGPEFYRECTMHMKHRFTSLISDEELISSAKKFKTKSAWATAFPKLYHAAKWRKNGVFSKCTAHMVHGNALNGPFKHG